VRLLPTLGAVTILFWLAVPIGVTLCAAVVVGLVGRFRDDDPDPRSPERLQSALARPLPRKVAVRTTRPSERPSGVAVRAPRRDA